MNTKTLMMVALSCLAANTASAGTNTWTKGWAMGTTEYAVDEGNGNELVIACPNDDDRYVSASASVSGQAYNSEDGQGFDLIVDGKTFHNPFYTDCRACSSIFTHGFWVALRKANRLQISAQGKVFNLPTKNLKAVLPTLNDKNNSCKAAW